MMEQKLNKYSEKITQDVCADIETELAEFNGEGEHVHLLVF